ncbi:hypothetical protein [Streptomyces sp. NPDC001070]
MSDSTGSRRDDDLGALLPNRAPRRSPEAAGRIGGAGPGPSSAPGTDGIPDHGNRRSARDAGFRIGFPNPEHR